MRPARVHILGASGSGTTTLGRTLAIRYARPHFDADDLFWLPTSPPFRERRPLADRLRLANELFVGRPDWILSGSLDAWGGELAVLFDIVVFLDVPTDVRLSRLRRREQTTFGAAACLPGGARHQEHEEFIDWASGYEDGARPGRTRKRHEAWLSTLACPVLRLDGTRSPDTLVEAVSAALP